MAQKGTPVIGQACTVTEGPNKGKKGTYTRDDEGNVWCEGDWGGTECGEDKCSDAKSQVSIFDFTAPDGVLLYEVEGLIEGEGGALFQAHVIMEAESGAVRKASAVPVVGTSLRELRESKSEVERRAANVLEATLRGDKKGR